MTSISYRDEGKGTPLVLVHGFCESKDVWADFSSELSSKFRVITPDLPGFGDSKLDVSDTSMIYYADKLYHFLKQLGIEKSILIGHSLGGYVTLSFAEKYEEMLLGIGLFHSTAFEDTQEKKDNRDRTIKFVEKHGVEAFASTAVTPLFYPPKREELKTEIELMTRIAAGSSREGLIAATKAMRDRIDRTEVLKKVKCPVLFIVGKEDQSVTLEKSREQCYLPQHSVVHFLADTAHMGMFERKKDTLKIVESFAELVVAI